MSFWACFDIKMGVFEYKMMYFVPISHFVISKSPNFPQFYIKIVQIFTFSISKSSIYPQKPPQKHHKNSPSPPLKRDSPPTPPHPRAQTADALPGHPASRHAGPEHRSRCTALKCEFRY
jgi:hypothetical protein